MVDWAEQIWYNSWTKLLAWLAGIPSILLLVINEINLIITDPTFKGYLDILEVPRPVTIGLTVFSILVWLAHGRKND